MRLPFKGYKSNRIPEQKLGEVNKKEEFSRHLKGGAQHKNLSSPKHIRAEHNISYSTSFVRV